MNKNHLTQLIVGAGLLTAVFYIGMQMDQTPLLENKGGDEVELANDDLTLRTPLLPRDSGEAAESIPSHQLPNLQNVQAPELPNHDSNGDSSRQAVRKPDFSALRNRGAAATNVPGALDVAQSDQGLRDRSDINVPSLLIEEGTRTPGLRGFSSPPPREMAPNNAQGFQPLLPLDNSTELAPEGQAVLNRTWTNESGVASSPSGSSANSKTTNTPRLTSISTQRISIDDLPNASFRVHVVRTGESLQTISERYYHTPDYYLEIYLANQNDLDSPLNLPAGTSIKIPDMRVDTSR
ncbi:MAG: LysM peptidoglycan-binding domain-containing protein [Pirellulaceae bacterium]